ncbi:uncharacterized protein [Heterodontus francisci]|uniref:uncharacterized protein isoform X4 n=1 Tax=Heterodontus francisci TaxID=7792 RepID=UPI00355BA146
MSHCSPTELIDKPCVHELKAIALGQPGVGSHGCCLETRATPAQPEALLHVGGEISQGRGGSSSYKRHRPGEWCTGNRRLLWAHIHRTNKPINTFRNQPKQLDDVVIQKDCKERCMCSAVGLVCEEISCTTDEKCGIKNGVMGCYNKGDSFGPTSTEQTNLSTLSETNPSSLMMW